MAGEQMAVRLHSRDVGGAFTIIEAHVPPFIGPPLYFHKEREEIFEVLEGGFRFHCAGEEFDIAPGTTVVVLRSALHGWVNLGPGPGPARLLFTFVPGGSTNSSPKSVERPLMVGPILGVSTIFGSSQHPWLSSKERAGGRFVGRSLERRL